ncbi:lipopolysaccharide transport periplasmic protein LptA [Dyella japonica]|uniref:Sugar transporter n=1 Tax=Dyella japonica A8 TaxID=1217721 RepID=A0A075JVP3_9GAMM|nr:lipopolysaccharide transport periplasmic protein LptA [Dyella japonica]AIF45999.1 sugar transporter [Dyella japonica A8]
MSLLWLWSVPLPSLAREADRNAPITTVAKVTNAYDSPNSVTTLTGHVKVTQGSLVVTGDSVKLYFDASQQISRAVVTGHPAHIQELDEQGRLIQGDAETLDYDNENRIAVLSKGAVVTMEGQGEVHGDKLTYHFDSTALIGESGEEGLVHGTMLPRHTPGQGAAGVARP